MSSQQPPESGTPNENRTGGNWSERRYERREWRRHNHPLRGLFWGLLLIVLGILFFGEKQGWFPNGNWWQYLLIAIGGCFIVDSLISLAIRQPYYEIAGKLIPGAILVCIGLAFIYGFEKWWPLILVAAGVVILISVVFRRHE